MILKEIYHKEFMRRKVDEQYLQKYENVIVLGERFLEQYYVVVFQAEFGINRNNFVFYKHDCINDFSISESILHLVISGRQNIFQ